MRVLFFLLFLVCAGPVMAQPEIEPRPYFPQGELSVRGQDGELSTFRIELATSDKQRRYGLKFLKSMDQNEGMLFDFGEMRKVRMWMQDTELPLDMIFINDKGKIVYIVKNTEPLSEAIIDSLVPVKGVLELNAGAAEDYFIRIGDEVLHPIFGTSVLTD